MFLLVGEYTDREAEAAHPLGTVPSNLMSFAVKSAAALHLLDGADEEVQSVQMASDHANRSRAGSGALMSKRCDIGSQTHPFTFSTLQGCRCAHRMFFRIHLDETVSSHFPGEFVRDDMRPFDYPEGREQIAKMLCRRRLYQSAHI